jgi:hypothetical protein
MSARENAILRLGRDPRLAHAAFFGHRHPDPTPDFHYQMIDDWHSQSSRFLFLAFRGGAKSTIAEEAIIVQACFRRFENCVLLGENNPRACDRLRAIKHEFETNPFIEELFGSLIGQTWNEDKIVLRNGVCIQVLGQGQSMRGVKHLAKRPDLLAPDDVEDEESVQTPGARAKTLNWFMSTVMPSLDPKARIRMNATPLHPQALSELLAANPTWKTRRYPIEYKGKDGERVPLWPGRFPLKLIDEIEADYKRQGMTQQYAQEYMVRSEDPATKVFTADMFKVEALVRTWEPVYAIYDPARTAKSTSSHNAKVVGSWVNNRLVIWDSFGKLLKPDELIADIFETNEKFRPVVIGVEETGLNEYLLQPIRQAQLTKGILLPLRALDAPKGKLDFIKSLQPFFRAGEVIFAGECKELEAQLLGYPTGRIDVPNALAYFLRIRSGQPVYDDFGYQHVVEELAILPEAPLWLAINATEGYLTGALLQFAGSSLRIFNDFVVEGGAEKLSEVLKEAQLEAGRAARLVTTPQHFIQYDHIGLRAAAVKIPTELRKGGPVHEGREELRGLMRRVVKSRPALQVSSKARWTLNGFAAGYVRPVSKAGVLLDHAQDGVYKTLLEGVESFAALLKLGALTDSNEELNYDYTASGKRFISARAR